MDKVKSLIEMLIEKDSLSEVIKSDEFVNLITELEDKGDIRTEIAKKVVKGMGWNGRVVKNDLPEQLKEMLEFVYWQGYTVGLNVGRNLTAHAIESLIRSALAKIDQEERDLRLKVARIFTYFFKDGKEVNEVEKSIMKILKKQGFSYREIAKIVGRSLDTIHRHLKVED